jgi:hypothetical protein
MSESRERPTSVTFLVRFYYLLTKCKFKLNLDRINCLLFVFSEELFMLLVWNNMTTKIKRFEPYRWKKVTRLHRRVACKHLSFFLSFDISTFIYRYRIVVYTSGDSNAFCAHWHSNWTFSRCNKIATEWKKNKTHV